MTTLEAIELRIAERHLLKHPFYAAWTAGTLPREALLDYVAQYYAFESNLPRFLTTLHGRCESPAARSALLSNAWDEEHGPNNHSELWLRFGESLGLERSQITGARPNAATRALVDTYREAVRSAPVEAGVAALYAYESQLPAVAEAKIAGLRAHYGFGERSGEHAAERAGEGPTERSGEASARGLAFFEVHRAIDVHHAAEERTIIATCDDRDETEESGDRADAAIQWAELALQAWWDFLSAVYPAGEGVNLMSRMASLN